MVINTNARVKIDNNFLNNNSVTRQYPLKHAGFNSPLYYK
jgi:hypothetical protein